MKSITIIGLLFISVLGNAQRGYLYTGYHHALVSVKEDIDAFDGNLEKTFLHGKGFQFGFTEELYLGNDWSLRGRLSLWYSNYRLELEDFGNSFDASSSSHYRGNFHAIGHNWAIGAVREVRQGIKLEYGVFRDRTLDQFYRGTITAKDGSTSFSRLSVTASQELVTSNLGLYGGINYELNERFSLRLVLQRSFTNFVRESNSSFGSLHAKQHQLQFNIAYEIHKNG